MAFSIRDDDVSYFTSPRKLEIVYQDAWEKGFRVSFGIVPMHKAVKSPNVPPSFRGENSYNPIYHNQELVDFLKARVLRGEADVVQHGYCHTEDETLEIPRFYDEHGQVPPSGLTTRILRRASEFYGLSEGRTLTRIAEGKAILETTFGNPVRVFVSPQELLTRAVWNALKKTSLAYCGGLTKRALLEIPQKDIQYLNMIRIALKKLLGPDGGSVAWEIPYVSEIITIPATYRHYWNKFTSDSLAEYWLENFKREFNRRIHTKSYFVLLTHHWEYFYDWEEEVTQGRQLDYLRRILDHVDGGPSVWKCSLTQLVEELRK